MTPSSVASVAPNAPKTPMKSFRIPEDVYRAAQAEAQRRGETLTDVVRRALEEYGHSE